MNGMGWNFGLIGIFMVLLMTVVFSSPGDLTIYEVGSDGDAVARVPNESLVILPSSETIFDGKSVSVTTATEGKNGQMYMYGKLIRRDEKIVGPGFFWAALPFDRVGKFVPMQLQRDLSVASKVRTRLP